LGNNDLSPGAKKLLRHFEDKGFLHRDFESSDTLKGLFNKAEECEAAQAELAGQGLLELGPPRGPSESDRVRSAALTLNGIRFLQRNPSV
jgi:hypothetical protein